MPQKLGKIGLRKIILLCIVGELAGEFLLLWLLTRHLNIFNPDGNTDGDGGGNSEGARVSYLKSCLKKCIYRQNVLNCYVATICTNQEV